VLSRNKKTKSMPPVIDEGLMGNRVECLLCQRFVASATVAE